MKRLCGYLFFVLYLVAAVVAVAVEFVPAHHAPKEIATEGESVDIELVFVGDIMAHLPQVESAHIGSNLYDFGPHFASIAPLFHGADYVVANLETTLSPRPPYSGYPAFATPDRLAYDLAHAGVDFVTLANNHIVDRGSAGVLHTIAALDNVGIAHTGASVGSLYQGTTAGRVVEIQGLCIALLGYTYGVNGTVPNDAQVAILEESRVRGDIDNLPSDVDLIVALVHWGNEYQRTPSTHQLQMAQQLRSLGVDLIIGSHPHVTQPYQEWTNEEGACTGGVYYSLGNFISNQNDRHTDYGLAARVGVHKSDNSEMQLTLAADTLYRHRYHLDGHQYFRVSPTR